MYVQFKPMIAPAKNLPMMRLTTLRSTIWITKAPTDNISRNMEALRRLFLKNLSTYRAIGANITHPKARELVIREGYKVSLSVSRHLLRVRKTFILNVRKDNCHFQGSTFRSRIVCCNIAAKV